MAIGDSGLEPVLICRFEQQMMHPIRKIAKSRLYGLPGGLFLPSQLVAGALRYFPVCQVPLQQAEEYISDAVMVFIFRGAGQLPSFLDRRAKHEVIQTDLAETSGLIRTGY